MFRLLAPFWLRRFLRLFLIVALALGLMDILQSGWQQADIPGVLAWAALAGALAASINTWWAWKHQCGLPSTRNPEQ